MKIERTHHLNITGLDDEDGVFDEPFYEHDFYRFTEGNVVLRARSYRFETHEAHFLGLEIDGTPKFLEPEDFARPLFLEALDYFRQEGKTEFNFLDQTNPDTGYSKVPDDL